MRTVIRALEEDGYFHKEEDFLLYGNPISPKTVILFEKQAILQKAIEAVDYTTKRNSLFICGYGIPSKKCMNYVRTLKSKNIVYFGDLDASSFYTYMVYRHCKRMLTPKDKIKLNVRYAGVTVDDYDNYLFDKNILVKPPQSESHIIDFIEKFKISELKRELKFLKEKNAKIEMEAVSRYGFENYFKDKLR